MLFSYAVPMNSGQVITRFLLKSRSSSLAALTSTVTELSYSPLETSLRQMLR